MNEQIAIAANKVLKTEVINANSLCVMTLLDPWCKLVAGAAWRGNDAVQVRSGSIHTMHKAKRLKLFVTDW